MAKRVQFDIVGNDKTASGINSAISNLNRLDGDVKRITKTFDVLKGSIIVGFATQAVKAIGQFAASCITDFSKVEKAQLRLELAMQSTGGTLSSINGFINELALKSSASATDLTILASEIAALGKTQPEIEKLMTAANALAEATGTNVTEAFKKLQSTYTGSVDELGKLIPELRTLSKEQLANGDAVDIVTAKFKDFVDVTGASTAQSIKNYSDAISTLKETLGQGWAEAFQPLVNAATEAVNKVIEQLNRASAAKRRASGQADIVTTVSKGDSAGLSKAAEGMSSAELRDAYRLAVQANPLATAKQQAALDQLLVLVNERVSEERKAAQAAEKASTITSTTTTAVIPTTATVTSKPDAFEEFVKAIRNEMGMASGRPVETGIEEYGDAMWSTGNGSRGGYSAFGGQDMSFLTLLGEALTPIIGQLGGMFTALSSVSQILNPLQTIFTAMFVVLEPVINQLLTPIVGILNVLGQLLAAMLMPALTFLTPVIELISKAFVWLYNNAIMPFANGIIKMTTWLFNGVAKIVNGLITVINKIPGVDIGWRMTTMDVSAMLLKKIDLSTLTAAGSATVSNSTYSGTTSSGNAASYTAQRDVIFNYYNYGVIAGSSGMKELALEVRDALTEQNILGR